MLFNSDVQFQCKEIKFYVLLFSLNFHFFNIILFIFDCAGPLWPLRVFSSCSEQGLLSSSALGLLIVTPSLVVEHGL